MATWSVNDEWGGVVNYNDGTFDFPTNMTTETRDYVITYSDGNKECVTTVHVKGIGTSDCCNGIDVEVIDSIPSDGTSGGNVSVATFTSICPSSNISLLSSTINGMMIDDGVIVVTDCSENPNSGATHHTIDIMYDGSFCKSINVTQSGVGIRCECSDISKMIALTNRVYDNNAHSHVLIASANTHGCGEVSASTNSIMLAGGDLIRVDVSESIYEFYADILANPEGSNRTMDINVYFKKKNSTGSFVPCSNYAIGVLQTERPPICDDISFTGNLKNSLFTLLTSEEEEINLNSNSLKMYYYTGFTANDPHGYYAISMEVMNGDASMVKTYEMRKYTWDSCDVLNKLVFNKNTSSAQRTVILKFKAYHSVTFVGAESYYTNDNWVGGVECGSCTLTVVQPGVLAECDCDDYYLKFLTNIEGDITTIELDRNDGDVSVYVRPQGRNSSKPCSIILPERYEIELTYEGDDNFIETITKRGYDSVHRYYRFDITLTQYPRVSSTGYFKACLKDANQGGAECACNQIQINRSGLKNCTNCEQDVKSKINISTNIAKPNGFENLTFISLEDICSYNYSYELVDSAGNPTSYTWVRDLYYKHGASSIGEYGGADYIYGTVDPNFSNSSRTVYVKVTPLKENGEELIPGCSVIVSGTQPKMNSCNCENFGNDTKKEYTTSASPETFYVGETNKKLAEVSISAVTTHLDCIGFDVDTTQTEYSTNHRAIFARSGVTASIWGYMPYIVFEIRGDIINNSGTRIDETGVSAKIDWHLTMNGSRCTGNANLEGFFSILVKNRPSS